MSHDEYIKKRDEMKPHYYDGDKSCATYTFEDCDCGAIEDRQAIDELVLAVIGEDDKPAQAQLVEKRMQRIIDRNMLRIGQRSIVKGAN